VSLTELPTDPMTRLERDALMAILQHPSSVGPELVRRATQVRFSNATLAVVRDAVGASLDYVDSPEWLQRIGTEVPSDFSTLVTQLGVAPIPERSEQLAVYCEGVVASLVDRDILRRKAEVLGAMQRATDDGDQERWATLNRESAALESERRALRKE
jgi:DNA primase